MSSDGGDGGADGADGAADGTGGTSDGTDGTADGTDGADGTEGGCDLAVGRTWPADGSGGGHYRSTVSVWTGTEPTEAEIVLVDDAGEGVAGAVSTFGVGAGRWRVDFAPSSPLRPLTVYTASLTACGSRYEFSFQTDGLGTTPDCSPAGRTYRLGLADGRWLAPEGGPPTGLSDLLLAMDAPSGSRVDLVGAVSGTGDAQDACWPTNPFTTATWTEPHFAHGPRTALVPVGGVLAEVQAVTLAGDVRPDCTALDGVALRGRIDLRGVADALGSSVSDLCAAAAGAAAPCMACDDGEVACLDLHVEDVRAPVVGGDLVCVDQLDCHPDCSTSTCADPTLGVCD